MDNIWKDFEADNWFKRNKNYLDKKDLNYDPIIKLMRLYQLSPNKVIDIGSSNGYRLDFIRTNFNSSKNIAVDPSLEAINDGIKKFPKLEFINSLGEDLEINEKFDLVIINFVFHWIYRENLLKFVDKINTLINNNGFLIIGDFGTDSFIKRKYTHLDDNSFFTWKQPYWNIFISSGNYFEIAKLRFNHDLNIITSDISIENMGTIVVLKKMENYIHV